MAVMRLGVHVAVTGGRKRLDAEVKIVNVGVCGHVRDGLISNPVEHGKDRVEGDKHQRRAGDKGRPRSRHAAMADVGPEIETKSLRYDFAIAESEDTRPRHPLI